MRILMIVSRYGGDPRSAGGDVQGTVFGQLWAEAGHAVTYATSSYDGAPQEERRDGLRIVRLGKPELLPLNAYRYYRKHGDAFDAVYAEAFGGARFPFCAPLYAKQPLVAAWYQVNAPVFVHQMGRVLGGVAGLGERAVAKLHRKALIVTPSEARREDLAAHGFDPARIVAVPPVAIGDTGEPARIAGREPLIVWLGKLRRYKCAHHLLEALPQVLKRAPGARLVIAGRRGDDGYLRELRSRAHELGLAARVDFALDISEEEKNDLLSRSRALAVTSPVEGFGIVIVEAAARGTPAVVSDGVPEEVVTDGLNGLRYPFGDTSALAARLTDLLTSESKHCGLATNAARRAGEFTRSRLSARLEEVLQRAMARAAPLEAAV
jgi:glycosyltransferase involved in cell wall biosynthesis